MAVDELVLEAFEGDCSIKPPSAQPTTTPATTTTPLTTAPTPNPGSCDFQDENLCGWQKSAKDENFFPWQRTNGLENAKEGLQPNIDRTGADSG